MCFYMPNVTRKSFRENIMSKKYSLLVSIVLLLTLTAISSAVNRTWDDGAADGNWTVATNWSGDIGPLSTDDASCIYRKTGPEQEYDPKIV